MSDKTQAQKVAGKTLKNLDALQKEVNSTKQNTDTTNAQNENVSNSEPNQPTLFMLNNNAKYDADDGTFTPNDNQKAQSINKEKQSIYRVKADEQKTSYGTSAVVLACVSFVCLIFVIIAVATGLNFENASGFFLWVYTFILVPIGIIGSVLCGVISALFGIVAIFKSHNCVISWVGLGLSLVVLASVVIVNSIYLF